MKNNKKQTFNSEVLGEVFPIVISYTNSKDVLALGSLYSLLRFIGLENTMELYHAVLLEKKILFLGHNFPVGQLCKVLLFFFFIYIIFILLFN